MADNDADPDGDKAAEEQTKGSNTDRLKLWLNFAKFFLGTFVLGGTTMYLGHIHKNWQYDLDRIKISNEHLEKHAKMATTEDLDTRIRYADFVRKIAMSGEMTRVWTVFYDSLLVEKNEMENRKRIFEKQEIEKVQQLAESPIRGTPAEELRAREATNDIQYIRSNIYYFSDKIDRKTYGTYEKNFVDFRTLLNNAEMAQRAGRYREQRDILLDILARSPQSIHGYVLTELAFCYRSLHDFPNARKYMEQAVPLRAESASALYDLAILQKNDGAVNLALQTLDKALAISSNKLALSSNKRETLQIQLVKTGYLIHAGNRKAGLDAFEALQDELAPRDEFIINIAWFNAVADRRAEFYAALERAFEVDPQRTQLWLDQEVDTNKYAKDDRFRSLRAKYGRL